MNDYSYYLPELKTTTIFQDIEDEALIAMLDAMQPPIVLRKKSETAIEYKEFMENRSTFHIVLKADPAKALVPRRFKYDMPKFGEPGMMMKEITSLSRYIETMRKEGVKGVKIPHEPKTLKFDLYMLECSGEMLTKFYSSEIAPAQGIMLRNFLGILAQKVTDVRHELFLLRDGLDIYKPNADERDYGKHIEDLFSRCGGETCQADSGKIELNKLMQNIPCLSSLWHFLY